MKALYAAILAPACLIAQSIPMGNVGPNGPVSPWTLTNNQTGASAPSTSSVSTPAFVSPLTNGSLILVGTSAAVTSASGQLVNDTAGNSYALMVAGNQFGPGTPNTWCAANTHTTTSNVVTLSLVGSFAFPGKVVSAAEFVSSNGALSCSTNRDDVAGTQTTSGAPANNATCGASGGHLNLANPFDLVFIWFNYTAGTVSAGTSPRAWTLLGSDITANISLAEYWVEPTTFGANFSGTSTTSTTGATYQSMCAAFHP